MVNKKKKYSQRKSVPKIPTSEETAMPETTMREEIPMTEEPPSREEPPEIEEYSQRDTRKSPYTTHIISVQIGSVAYSIPKYFVSSYPRFGVDGWTTKLFLNGIDVDAGHTLIHYLYTGAYETLRHPNPDRSPRAIEFRRSVLAYHAARIFELEGLETHAKRYMRVFDDAVTLSGILVTVREVFAKLEDDVWLKAYVLEKMSEAFEADEKMFRNEVAQYGIGQDAVFDPVVFDRALDLPFKKMAEMRAESHGESEPSTNHDDLKSWPETEYPEPPPEQEAPPEAVVDEYPAEPSPPPPEEEEPTAVVEDCPAEAPDGVYDDADEASPIEEDYPDPDGPAEVPPEIPPAESSFEPYYDGLVPTKEPLSPPAETQPNGIDVWRSSTSKAPKKAGKKGKKGKKKTTSNRLVSPPPVEPVHAADASPVPVHEVASRGPEFEPVPEPWPEAEPVPESVWEPGRRHFVDLNDLRHRYSAGQA